MLRDQHLLFKALSLQQKAFPTPAAHGTAGHAFWEWRSQQQHTLQRLPPPQHRAASTGGRDRELPHQGPTESLRPT